MKNINLFVLKICECDGFIEQEGVVELVTVSYNLESILGFN